MSRSSEQSSKVEVALPAALHARPAGAVARVAAGFTARAGIQFGARSADARSALRLMALGAPAGATVLVHAEGPDAEAAAGAIAEALRSAT